MRKWVLWLLKVAYVGLIASLPVAAIANYTATQGAGTNFGSVVIAGVHFMSQLLCDATTANQCAAVSAAGAVKVDNSAVTQPVSAASLPLPTGAATAALQTTGNTTLTTINTTLGSPFQAGGALAANQSVNESQINGVTPLMGNGVTGTGSQRVTIASDNTAFSVNATLQAAATTAIGKVDPNTVATWGLAASSQNVAAPTNGWLGLCQFTTSPATISTTNVSPLQCDSANRLIVDVATATGLAQGSTTSGQTGSMIMGAVTTAAPSYTTAQTAYASLTTAGALRSDINSVAGTTILTGTGAVGAGSPRVAIAIDSATVAGSASLPAGTNSIGSVNLAANVTTTACSGTITSGGTAQNAFTAQTTLHGFTVANIDTTEPLWISFTTTAAASGTDSYPLPAATATTFAGFGSFTAPPGFGLNHALSVIAATTAHKFSCTWW